MKVLERSMEPVSVMDRCDYPATRKKESRGMEREITQPENEELGALEWLMGIEEAYAEKKKSAGYDSDRAMSKLHDNWLLFAYSLRYRMELVFQRIKYKINTYSVMNCLFKITIIHRKQNNIA